MLKGTEGELQMLKKHSEFFRRLLLFSDLVALCLMWLLAYYLRFHTNLVPVYYGIPPIEPYLFSMIAILLIWTVVFKAFNLYRPRRTSPHVHEILDIGKACTLTVIILIALTYFLKKFEFSRVVFLYFWILSIAALTISRVAFREGLRFFRRQGYNLRHIVIVGDGILARDVVQRVNNHPELGLNIMGLFSGNPERVGKKVHGKEIMGTFKDIKQIVQGQDVDQVFVALPFSKMGDLENIITSLQDQTATIKIIPDFYHFLPFCGSVEEFDGLPVFNLYDTPLYGWNAVAKRASDIVIASLAIAFTLPLMAVIAAAIKLTSSGPVLYKQRRAGLDGKAFTIYKFRTMHVDAEKDSGPVYAAAHDPRRTKFGAILRRTSLDELLQLLNVLKGDMSLVGPRPERPEFISDFRKNIPRYMLRHKMKAGITGWAQVNGWRGDTSIQKRIEHDLYYIENWSLSLDFRIMWLTIWKGLVHKHAY